MGRGLARSGRAWAQAGLGSTVARSRTLSPLPAAMAAALVLRPNPVGLYSLQGDATYLIVTDENKVESYGVNAVCTHLGCVVPWNKAENKFMCPW